MSEEARGDSQAVEISNEKKYIITVTAVDHVEASVSPLCAEKSCNELGKTEIVDSSETGVESSAGDSHVNFEHESCSVKISEANLYIHNFDMEPQSTAVAPVQHSQMEEAVILEHMKLYDSQPASNLVIINAAESGTFIENPTNNVDSVGKECTEILQAQNVTDQTVDQVEPNPSYSQYPGSSEPSEASKMTTSTQSEGKPTRNYGLASDLIHQIKWVPWHGHKTPIVTQNENGPCPLLAVINVLLLRGQVTIPDTADYITTEKLLQRLGDCILRLIPKDFVQRPDFQQNMNDSLYILPKLSTGLDVNVRFTGVTEFEYTPECIVFDLLDMHLYHGWLVDRELDQETTIAIGNLTYNQLVEKIIDNKFSSDSAKIAEAILAEQFLYNTASQLTQCGLDMLKSHMREGELAVFFRNNHFSTVLKHEGNLILLVTDQGFINEHDVIWETLEDVGGNSKFLNAQFEIVPPKLPPDEQIDFATEAVESAGGISPKQLENDLLVAMSLEQEQRSQVQPSVEDDLKLAMQLQQQEEVSAGQSAQPFDPSTASTGSQDASDQSRKKKAKLSEPRQN